MRSFRTYQSEQSQLVTINGVTMTQKEFKEMRKKANLAPKKTKRVKKSTTCNIVADEVKDLVKEVKVLKSLVSFKDHSYRMWGTIARDLLKLKEIEMPFNQVCMYTRELNGILKEIEKLSKANSTDVFQFVCKLNWKLDDIKKQLTNLIDGISSSHVMQAFGKHEIIKGSMDGKRLGIKTLSRRSYRSVIEIGNICNELTKIEKEGKNPFEYYIK